MLKLRQLAGIGHGLSIHDKGRQSLRVAVRGGMHIEHKADQRPFQPGACAEIQGKTGTGDFGGSLKVQYPQ